MKSEQTKKESNVSLLFNIVTVLLLLYMAYSMYTTYTQLVAYCDYNNTTITAQWSYCLQAFLAAIVPCMIYACTSYGIGIIIKNQQLLLQKK